jgi:hypothetical protein
MPGMVRYAQRSEWVLFENASNNYHVTIMIRLQI